MQTALLAFWILVSLVAGFVVGKLYFAWLRHSLEGLADHDSPLRRVAVMAALRLVLVVVIVAGVLALDVGVVYVLCGLVGFLAARVVALMEQSDSRPKPPPKTGNESGQEH